MTKGTAGLVLAAGRSTRFGDADKLLADVRGRPLASYCADAIREAAPEMLVAVTRSKAVSRVFAGFQIVEMDNSGCKQSDSLRAGVELVQSLGADRLLVVLADMPFVTSALMRRVIRHCGTNGPAAATDGKSAMPPVCFPRSHFGDLLSLGGDEGARSLLADLPRDRLVAGAIDELRDIDTPRDLAGSQ